MESTSIFDILSKQLGEKAKGLELIEFDANNQLSAKERTFREYGIKDNKGEYTPIALELILQKLTRDNEDYLLELIANKEKGAAKEEEVIEEVE